MVKEMRWRETGYELLAELCICKPISKHTRTKSWNVSSYLQAGLCTSAYNMNLLSGAHRCKQRCKIFLRDGIARHRIDN